MWELLQSSIIPVIIVVLLIKFFGGNASESAVPTGTQLNMEILAGSQLTKADGKKKNASEIFSENDVVLLYLSAHWCPPCRNFTPHLATIYNNLKKAGKKIEVIFLSADRTEESMFSYMKESHGDWFASEFGTPLKDQVSGLFGVRGIPTLIVLSGAGKVISTEGRNDIDRYGADAWDRWIAAASSSASTIDSSNSDLSHRR